MEAYKLTKEQKSLIKEDELNKKLWDEAMESLSLGPVCTVFKLSFFIHYEKNKIYIFSY